MRPVQPIADLEQALQRIAHLEQQLAWYQHQFHGRSSERNPREVCADQAHLFNEPEMLAVDGLEPSVTIPEHRRKRSTSKAISKELPRVAISHDIPESEKVCPHDGTALERMAPEESEQLDIIPGKVRVLLHQRHKYVCPCC